MNRTILNDFLLMDCSESLKVELLDAIANTDALGLLEFNTNRYNISIDHQAKQVIIADDLDASTEGEYRISFNEFSKIMKNWCLSS